MTTNGHMAAAIAVLIVFFVFLFFAVKVQIREQNECNQRGGVYVKQAFGYGCLEQK